MPRKDWIGDPTPSHPLPLRLRNCNIEKRQGGSFGWRGKGYGLARRKALWLAGNRSTLTGRPQGQVTLEVDHIMPYRMGGVGPITNTQQNLRVMDQEMNASQDAATGFREKRVKRRLRRF